MTHEEEFKNVIMRGLQKNLLAFRNLQFRDFLSEGESWYLISLNGFFSPIDLVTCY